MALNIQNLPHTCKKTLFGTKTGIWDFWKGIICLPVQSFKIGANMYTFEVYQDKRGEYRWRYKARNGNILAVSSEGYSSKRACFNCVESVKKSREVEVVLLDQ